MKNNSARKKLIPAAAMLAVSAAMLATSTYAWFTMSKEAEVTGIQLTASTPAGIQISLGKGQSTGDTLDGNVGNITAPTEDDADADWANSVAFSDFYNVGKLAPASSNTGEDIYYTNDATGVGKTLKDGAAFYQADTGTPIKMASLVKRGTDPSSDAGYYVDFPVWFRSSAAEGNTVNLAVTATFATGAHSGNLYKSARVVVLDNTATTNGVSDKIIMTSDTKYYNADNDENTHNTTVSNVPQAVSGLSGTAATWGNVTAVTQATLSGGVATAGDAVVTMNNTSTESGKVYGPAVKRIIRVWLEGEDVNCFNTNAGQDFVISLKFTKLETT